VRRIITVMNSNDPVARALTLRTLGTWYPNLPILPTFFDTCSVSCFRFSGALNMGNANPGCLFRIPNPNFSIPDPGSASSNFKYFNPKFFFQTLENMVQVVHPGSGPDLDHDFSPILDPRSRGQKGNGSRIRIRNTVGKGT
jgi:hypothetical protein